MNALVYENFYKKIEILPNKFLVCSNKHNDYSIICEYADSKYYFVRVVWNIDNGFNTEETIQKEIENIVREVRELVGEECC